MLNIGSASLWTGLNKDAPETMPLLKNRTARRFTLADGMVLVAATAAGLALSRPYVRSLGGALAGPGLGVIPRRIWLGAWSPYLMAWSSALAILSLRAPRPSRRHLGRQPGGAACHAPRLVLFLRGLMALYASVSTMQVFPYYRFILGTANLPGPAIAAVWLNLAIGRRWCPEPDWVDRAGRLIGVLWIALFLFMSLVP